METLIEVELLDLVGFRGFGDVGLVRRVLLLVVHAALASARRQVTQERREEETNAINIGLMDK